MAAFKKVSIMMKEETQVRPDRPMSEKIAEIPEFSIALNSGNNEKDQEENIHNSLDHNQSEKNVKEFLKECPHLSQEQAINWLSEFPLPEAIRLAKKLSFQAKIPSWAVPGLNRATTTMSQSELKNLRVVKNPATGSLTAALGSRVDGLSDAVKNDSMDKSAQQVDGHRNSLAPFCAHKGRVSPFRSTSQAVVDRKSDR
ncbi:hypothetical protein GCK72_022077 [Caenorhabditis remanei]|uniref:Uncharacterized protein n=1 Tax=Caenorhabditis remanei TaxID=31234 RepID=A0A6A5FSS4_CAERE|nr:hypothetical protein GCK72_022077 [Caenorhabditis remanei]KAF1745630.1 hypothetical protein GCK72_022077 [Caenorhabditis remanei]